MTTNAENHDTVKRRFRCPYCRQSLGAEPQTHCPACGKVMMVPDSLAHRTLRDRQKAKARIQRQMERERAGLRIPDASFARKPSLLLLAMAALTLTGALLVQRTFRAYAPPSTDHRVQQAARNLDTLRVALERFRRDAGRYPTADEGLRALRSRPEAEGWQGPYVRAVLPDPWDRPYRYEPTNDTVRLVSLGPDGVFDTDDDVVSVPPSEAAIHADREPATGRLPGTGEKIYPIDLSR